MYCDLQKAYPSLTIEENYGTTISLMGSLKDIRRNTKNKTTTCMCDNKNVM
jgi:hypothetical protein